MCFYYVNIRLVLLTYNNWYSVYTNIILGTLIVVCSYRSFLFLVVAIYFSLPILALKIIMRLFLLKKYLLVSRR